MWPPYCFLLLLCLTQQGLTNTPTSHSSGKGLSNLIRPPQVSPVSGLNLSSLLNKPPNSGSSASPTVTQPSSISTNSEKAKPAFCSTETKTNADKQSSCSKTNPSVEELIATSKNLMKSFVSNGKFIDGIIPRPSDTNALSTQVTSCVTSNYNAPVSTLCMPSFSYQSPQNNVNTWSSNSCPLDNHLASQSLPNSFSNDFQSSFPKLNKPIESQLPCINSDFQFLTSNVPRLVSPPLDKSLPSPIPVPMLNNLPNLQIRNMESSILACNLKQVPTFNNLPLELQQFQHHCEPSISTQSNFVYSNSDLPVTIQQTKPQCDSPLSQVFVSSPITNNPNMYLAQRPISTSPSTCSSSGTEQTLISTPVAFNQQTMNNCQKNYDRDQQNINNDVEGYYPQVQIVNGNFFNQQTAQDLPSVQINPSYYKAPQPAITDVSSRQTFAFQLQPQLQSAPVTQPLQPESCNIPFNYIPFINPSANSQCSPQNYIEVRNTPSVNQAQIQTQFLTNPCQVVNLYPASQISVLPDVSCSNYGYTPTFISEPNVPNQCQVTSFSGIPNANLSPLPFPTNSAPMQVTTPNINTGTINQEEMKPISAFVKSFNGEASNFVNNLLLGLQNEPRDIDGSSPFYIFEESSPTIYNFNELAPLMPSDSNHISSQYQDTSVSLPEIISSLQQSFDPSPIMGVNKCSPDPSLSAPTPKVTLKLAPPPTDLSFDSQSLSLSSGLMNSQPYPVPPPYPFFPYPTYLPTVVQVNSENDTKELTRLVTFLILAEILGGDEYY